MDAHRFTRVTAAVGLLGLASLALIGCQQENRYCDDTGCFYCDGLGCRTITPPVRAACDCDYECADGSDCTSLGCTVECEGADDAARTDFCHSLGWPRCSADGFCVANAETTVTNLTCTCATSADCDDGLICRDSECVPGCESAGDCDAGQVCIDGACQTVVHSGCSSTSPCPAGRTCVDGECRIDTGPMDETCQFNSECGAGRVCVNERCSSACGLDNPCPTGAACMDGFCREQLPPTGDCVVNSDCAAMEICVDTRCLAGCDADTDCTAGNYCDLSTGTCRYDDRLDPSCGGTRMCAPGSVCRNGSCRSPCTEDSECPRFDVQFNFCVEMVCATTNEATSDCANRADCMTGEDCIDGICR